MSACLAPLRGGNLPGSLIRAGLTGAVLAFLTGAGVAARAGEVPQRIVSLNLCTDQILLELVPKERIAALSFLARDPIMSADAAGASGIRTVRGTAEEVLELAPDLVLTGEYSTPATQSLLRRLGVNVVTVPMASSFEQIRDAVRLIAKAAGVPERGEEVVAAFDRRLAAARVFEVPEPSKRPTALAYQVNSLASAPGSLMDEMLAAAGFRNMASDTVLGPGGRMPLETLVLSPPDLLVLANASGDFRTVLGDNLRHPAMMHLLAIRPSLRLPMPLWLCGTPHAAEGVALLAAARAGLATGASP